MMELPKYIFRDTDRHGNVRYYYRRNGIKTRLHKPFGSGEFIKELEDLTGGAVEYRLPNEEGTAKFLYFIHYARKVKIGISRDFYKRYVQIRQGLPGHAAILYVTSGSRKLERELHRQFAKDRLAGEWFRYSQEIRDWIEADRRTTKREQETQNSCPTGVSHHAVSI